MPLRIANAAGFLGDDIDAPRRLVESAAVDYLTLEHLAELTLAVLARQRADDPSLGYARDFLEILRSLTPALRAQPNLKLVANSGGLNPLACARAAGALLVAAGLGDALVAVVTGDDLLPRLPELQAAGCPLAHADTGQTLAELTARPVSANAYLGARPIAGALSQGARIVLTGRVADASLTLGPAAHEFAWDWQDWDRLAAGTVAGHLIECGAQVTGGYSQFWSQLDLADAGFPIVELERDGSCVVTKPAQTGGAVNFATVAEQLIYEIGDPQSYITPDVVADFTSVQLQEVGRDRVAVQGARGRPAPESYKVALTYEDGYAATGQLLVYGTDCTAKARACAELIWQRLRRAGYEYARRQVELLGAGDGVPGLHPPPPGLREVVLRVSVHDPRKEAVHRFAKEFAPLITGGPAGLAGYATGRPTVRPVIAYWPTYVPRGLVPGQVAVRTAAYWSQTS